MDAICKKRGNSSSNNGVGDGIVNQLLTNIDGVDSVNNVLGNYSLYDNFLV